MDSHGGQLEAGEVLVGIHVEMAQVGDDGAVFTRRTSEQSLDRDTTSIHDIYAEVEPV